MSRFDIFPEYGPEEGEFPPGEPGVRCAHGFLITDPDECPDTRDRSYEMAAAERGVELPDLPFSNPWDEPSPEEEAYYASLAHDCPREQFLDDPITQAYGVGNEMLHLIHCEICEAREREL